MLSQSKDITLLVTSVVYIRKDAGKDWGQEEKRVTEDELVGWHHWLSGHESDQTPGDSEGQGRVRPNLVTEQQNKKAYFPFPERYKGLHLEPKRDILHYLSAIW